MNWHVLTWPVQTLLVLNQHNILIWPDHPVDTYQTSSRHLFLLVMESTPTPTNHRKNINTNTIFGILHNFVCMNIHIRLHISENCCPHYLRKSMAQEYPTYLQFRHCPIFCFLRLLWFKCHMKRVVLNQSAAWSTWCLIYVLWNLFLFDMSVSVSGLSIVWFKCCVILVLCDPSGLLATSDEGCNICWIYKLENDILSWWDWLWGSC